MLTADRVAHKANPWSGDMSTQQWLVLAPSSGIPAVDDFQDRKYCLLRDTPLQALQAYLPRFPWDVHRDEILRSTF